MMRPLSPHLQIYKPQITSVLSITHRISGVALVGASCGVSVVLACLAFAPQWAQVILTWLHAPPFSWMVVLCLWSLFYHSLNGVRHLIWDMGLGFEMRHVTLSGVAVVIGSVALTWSVL